MDFSIDPAYSVTRTISRGGAFLSLTGGGIAAYILSRANKTTNLFGHTVTTITGHKASTFFGALGISAVGLAATVTGSNFMIAAKEDLYRTIQRTSFFGDAYVFQPNAIKDHNNHVVAFYSLSPNKSQVTVEIVKNPHGKISAGFITNIKNKLVENGLSQRSINFVFSSKVSEIEQNALSGAKSVAFLQKEPIDVQNGNNVDTVHLYQDSLIDPQQFGCLTNPSHTSQSRGIWFKQYQKVK